MTLEMSVLEYLGKIGDGVLVLFSVVYNSEYYEATYFYKQDGDVLTLSEDLEAAIASHDGDKPDMDSVLNEVRSKVVPYDQIFGRLDDVNFGRWIPTEDTEETFIDTDTEL
jgi:hypothetical protein